MIEKIISGGQTGADRAALDCALKLGVAHGGWAPLARKAEDGVIPSQYRLQEMTTDSYAKRTEQNVIDSEGTVILSHGELTGGSALTRRLAVVCRRPYLHLDLNVLSPATAAQKLAAWVSEKDISVLNVAGPRESQDPQIYGATLTVLESAINILAGSTW